MEFSFIDADGITQTINSESVGNKVFHVDCMVALRATPDKFYDLCICDPPYGIKDKIISGGEKGRRLKIQNGLDRFDWVPSPEYFAELFRVSVNQVIWGGNYFPEHLSHSRGWLVWDKMLPDGFEFAKAELAYSSFNHNLEMFRYGASREKKEYHPTQKPIALYDWVLKLYAKPGQLILDTHVGSGSSRIAASKADLDFVGFEIDQEYWQAQENRFARFIAQGRLF